MTYTMAYSAVIQNGHMHIRMTDAGPIVTEPVRAP